MVKLLLKYNTNYIVLHANSKIKYDYFKIFLFLYLDLLCIMHICMLF